MSTLHLVMDSQAAWELRLVYLDHVVSDCGPEMTVSKVSWNPLPGTSAGVATVTLRPATVLSLREAGDARAFSQAGRRATTLEIDSSKAEAEGRIVRLRGKEIHFPRIVERLRNALS